MATSATCNFQFVATLCTAFSITVSLGCGSQGLDLGPFGRVSGRVTNKGKPVNKATITFSCPDSGQVATVDLQPDGGYTMSLDGREGLPIGKYYVYLLPILPQLKEGDTDFSRDRSPYNPDIAPEIPMKYRDESSSGLTAKVVEGDNSYTFELANK